MKIINIVPQVSLITLLKKKLVEMGKSGIRGGKAGDNLRKSLKENGDVYDQKKD